MRVTTYRLEDEHVRRLLEDGVGRAWEERRTAARSYEAKGA